MSERTQWPMRMNETDALFWLLDRIPDMRSTIGVLAILERMPSRQRLRAEFERVSDEMVRLRQRVVAVPLNLAPPEWVEDPQFDLDYHVRYTGVPSPGGIEEVVTEVGPLYATAFDRDRPLWEAYVVEGLMGGRGALFIKMHHCLVDGVGGSRLFAQLFGSQQAERDSRAAAHTRWVDRRSTTPAALVWRAAQYNLQEAMRTGGTLLGSLLAATLAPQATLTDLRHGLKALTGFGRELAVPRASSPLHLARSLSRQLSTFEMSLTEIDGVRRRLDATNNDIVLTVISGAMHRWHTSRGTDVNELRAMVPVNLRADTEDNSGNHLALLAMSLPVGEPNPLRRLRTIQGRMRQVKTDRRAALYPLLARVMLAMPLAIIESIGRQQASRTNFVCTNVPGPRQTCYFAGEVIERVYPYAPLVGDHPVAIALYSYRDVVCVGLDVDSMAMADLPHFRDALQEAYEEVLNIGHQMDAHDEARRSARRARRAA